MELFLIIGVIAILGISAIIGYARGFVKIVLSFAALIVATVIASLLTGPVCQLVYSTSVYEDVMDNVRGYVDGHLDLGVTNVAEIVDYNRLEDLKLPTTIVNKLNDELLANAENLPDVDAIAECIAEKFAGIVVSAGVFLFIFVLAFIALQVVILLADIVARLPGLNAVNRNLGLLCGLATGIIILWIGCVILTICSGTDTGMALMQIIYGNPFLNFIYSHNILLELLAMFVV